MFKTVNTKITIFIPEKSSDIVTRSGENVERALFNHKPATSKSWPLF